MKLAQVAVTFYTLCEHCKTAADFAASCKKVAGIGYRAIQISGVGPIPEAEIVAIANGEGLTICATHEPAQVLLEDPARASDRLAKLGCAYTAYPYPSGVNMADLNEVRALAARLDAAGAVLRQAGQTLCYHNHAVEFARLEGRTVYDWILSSTAPDRLQTEPDVYWAQYGGVDPAALCRRLAGRLPLLHLKDYAIGFDNKPYFAEVGHGNLDWPGIIAAAEEAGCRWFIVEQDTCPGDPFESLALSFAHIRDHLV